MITKDGAEGKLGYAVFRFPIQTAFLHYGQTQMSTEIEVCMKEYGLSLFAALSSVVDP